MPASGSIRWLPRSLVAATMAGVIAALASAAPADRGRARDDAMVAVPALPAIRVAVLPLTPRGAPAEAWSALAGPLAAALRREGLEPVDEEAVRQILRQRRLRDTSILTREDLLGLAESLGAERILIGDLYRFVAEPVPGLAFSGRLLNPDTLRIEAAAVTALDGRELNGVLGAGGPVTLDRTIPEAARRLSTALSAMARRPRDPGASARRLAPRASAIAPEPAQFLSEGLVGSRIRSIVVLPFRNATGRSGAGQAASDGMVVGLVASGLVDVVDAGDATRRLLQRGWRTGLPVGTGEVTALRDELQVDAVLMGSIDRWTEGDASGLNPPEVTLTARLLDGATGAILWTSSHERRGDQTRTFYEAGNVRLVEELIWRAASEMLAPLIDTLEETSSPSEGDDSP